MTDGADHRAGETGAGGTGVTSASLTAGDDGRAETVVALDGIAFAWARGRPVIDIETFRVARGERVFLRGPSGSGKSTLLGLLGGVLRPQRGEIHLLGDRFDALSDSGRDRFRAAHIGIVFQMFNLLPYLSLTDNVLLPTRLSKTRAARATAGGGTLEAEAVRLLDRLGLKTREMLRRPVTELSVGQQQRVAAARALIGQPEILIADEPTSALDTDARGAFLDLLIEECDRAGATLIFVSHDTTLTGHFGRTVDLPSINRAMPAGATSEVTR